MRQTKITDWEIYLCVTQSIYGAMMLKGSASNNDVMMTDLQKKLGLFLSKLPNGIYRTGLTWKHQNLGRKVEVIYMDEPCNAC